MKRIPLRNRFKEIVAYALVDDADFEMVNRFKWCLSGNGYVLHEFPNQKRKYLHQLLLNPPKKQVIDHIDGNRLNCQRSNLRICSQGENSRNQPCHKNSTSGFKGIHLFKRTGKWQVQITINFNKIHGGYFNNLSDAVKQYNELSKKYHGEFGRLNTIPIKH